VQTDRILQATDEAHARVGLFAAQANRSPLKLSKAIIPRGRLKLTARQVARFQLCNLPGCERRIASAAFQNHSYDSMKCLHARFVGI
jgi:hypothetical protein